MYYSAHDIDGLVDQMIDAQINAHEELQEAISNMGPHDKFDTLQRAIRAMGPHELNPLPF